MCDGQVTPENEHVRCNHCGKVANPSDRWEHGWPLYGKITIGLDCCALDYLWGDNWHETGLNFNHPAMLDSGFQEINFEWGNGHKFDSTGRYRLCWYCQRELMSAIGNFFKNDTILSKVTTPQEEDANNRYMIDYTETLELELMRLCGKGSYDINDVSVHHIATRLNAAIQK